MAISESVCSWRCIASEKHCTRKIEIFWVLATKWENNDTNGDQPQQLQQNALPLENHVVTVAPDPSPAPGVASKQPNSLTGIAVPQNPNFLPLNCSAFFEYNAGSENPFSPRFDVSDLSLMCLFTYEELAVATNDFSETNLLGEGGFGYVHRGILRNGKEVAVKQLKVGSSQGEREFQAEVEIISRVHHRHLVSLVGYCIAGARRMLVYEFVPNKTLDFHLHGEGRPTMDWATRLKIALGAAKGLAYLHEDCNPKIIHRDIKATNILLDFKFEAKVADFGLAKVISDAKTHVSTRVMGTFGYMAPEYASSGKLTDKSDVFSFGVVLLELITGRQSLISLSFMDESLVDWARPLLTRALEDGNYNTLVDPKLQKDYDPCEMASLIGCAAACVRHSAHLRPRMTQVVHALEKDILLADPEDSVRPEHKMVNGSHGNLDYGSAQYKDDKKKFRKMALGSLRNGDED
ncbi:hypothetical protein NE237_025562 [Protea cynaroides]|uniref:non-specific serine/threonine protein kinase n=1 Tax=Protea cynaroides TaxID=273540 RepID=A0A9Q0H4G2_9MAGN|nr:hypothetical protein NE237_025562 [Protea cynaroides]